MLNQLRVGFLPFVLLAGSLSVSSLMAANSKVAFEVLVFPDATFVDSERELDICLVNAGMSGEVSNDGIDDLDRIVISIPVGALSDDLTFDATSITCTSSSMDWTCSLDTLPTDEALLEITPVGQVSVQEGECLCFLLEGVEVNDEKGLVLFPVDQQVHRNRADKPLNDVVGFFKSDIPSLAHDDLAGVTDAQHHARYTDVEAFQAVLDQDGSGSGLDADLLDGQHASDFLTAADDHGRSGVASALFEGTNRLSDVYVNEGQADSVTSSMIVDGVVTSADIANATIVSSDIATGAVGSSEIATGAVGASELAANSVTSVSIVDGQVSSADIATDAVGSSEIATSAVGASELAANSVSSGEIVDGQVTGADIANETITSSDIATAAVGSSEIEDGAVTRLDHADSFKPQFVRVNTVNANEYVWNPSWYSASGRPTITTTGVPGQLKIWDSGGGVAHRIVIVEDATTVVFSGTIPGGGSHLYTATDSKLIEIYVWPYTFHYNFFIHFTGARERYDASLDYIGGLVRGGSGF